VSPLFKNPGSVSGYMVLEMVMVLLRARRFEFGVGCRVDDVTPQLLILV